jgi:hypothetical protein
MMMLEGGSFDSFGIYADVKKFLMDANVVVGHSSKFVNHIRKLPLFGRAFHKREGRPDLPGYRFERFSFLAT